MLTTVKGTYQDGRVELNEPAPAVGQAARPVLVIFLDAEAVALPAPSNPRFSWDEALARTAPNGGAVSLAEEVIAERRERD